jgi:hypothetical protein
MGTAGAWQIVPSQMLEAAPAAMDSTETNLLKRSAGDASTDEDTRQFKLQRKVLDAGRLAPSYNPDSIPIKVRVKAEASAPSGRHRASVVDSTHLVSPVHLENKSSELEFDNPTKDQTSATVAGAKDVKDEMGTMDAASSSLFAAGLPEPSKTSHDICGERFQTHEEEAQAGDTTKAIYFRKRKGPSRGK